MNRTIVLFGVLGLLSTGCVAPASNPPRTATATEADCGDPLRVAPEALTVEGFGGGGDTQLMMTRRQPTRQCAPQMGTTPTHATLGVSQ